jgi:hypothetical protein
MSPRNVKMQKQTHFMIRRMNIEAPPRVSISHRYPTPR